jgi:hypothetical protein
MTDEATDEVPDDDEFDLDAVIAEREPVKAFRFRFAGERYTLPGDPDLRAIAALRADRLDEGFRMLLGEKQWDRMQAADAVFDNASFEALFERYQKHVGDLGESQASTDS